MCDVVLALEEFCLENIDHHWLGLVVEIVVFGYAFVGLGLICDDYLVPSLEQLCTQWRISEDLAGATFMALGSGAPELILSTLVTMRAVTNDSLALEERHGLHRTSGLGVSTILGSGWIAFLLIPGACTLLAKREIQVSHGPLLRDVGFYTLALLFLYRFGFDHTFTFQENLAMILAYCLYTLVVLIQSMRQVKAEETVIVTDIGQQLELEPLADYSEVDDADVLREIDGDARVLIRDGEFNRQSVIAMMGACTVKPLRCVFSKTLPDLRNIETRFVSTMIRSFGWVVLFSWIITVIVSRWIKLTHLSSGIFGVSVVALGGQIPDAIQSVSAAKKGHGSMALANALGSQNLNVFLGLGIPWLFCSFSLGEPNGIELTHAQNLYLLGKITFGAVLVFFLCVSIPSATEPQITVTKCAAYILLVTYVGIVLGYTIFVVSGG